MTKLFLDLEDTVINNWAEALLVKTHKLQQLLAANPDIDRTDVTIFSFAIYNQKDKDEFERSMKPMLERTFGITCTAWPSVAEIAEADQLLTGCRWLDAYTMGGLYIHEFIAVRGKAGAFENWVWYHGVDGERYMLLDDVVPQRVIYDRKRDIQIDLVNVDKDL